MTTEVEILHQDEQLVLTTIDNPFNPKENYDLWRTWDIEHGYYTEEYLARVMDFDGIVDTEDELVLNELRMKAIQDILDNDVIDVYRLV